MLWLFDVHFLLLRCSSWYFHVTPPQLFHLWRFHAVRWHLSSSFLSGFIISHVNLNLLRSTISSHMHHRLLNFASYQLRLNFRSMQHPPLSVTYIWHFSVRGFRVLIRPFQIHHTVLCCHILDFKSSTLWFSLFNSCLLSHPLGLEVIQYSTTSSSLDLQFSLANSQLAVHCAAVDVA